jgi:hypothetical protein
MPSPPRPLSHSPSLASRLVVSAALLLTFVVPGCATYRFGNRSLYRCDIRTVHVPMVQSDSFRRNLGERLTEAIVKELELKTQYKVVDAASADSVLRASGFCRKLATTTRGIWKLTFSRR